jgi:cyclic beta-1,2-glucan synthetase
MEQTYLVAGYFASRAAATRVLALLGSGSLHYQLYEFGSARPKAPLEAQAMAWLRPGEWLLLIPRLESQSKQTSELLQRSGEALHTTVLTPALIWPDVAFDSATLRTRWRRSIAVIQESLGRQIRQSAGDSRRPAKWGIAESAYEDNLAGISLIEHRYIIDGYIERIQGLLKGTRDLRKLPTSTLDGVTVPLVFQLAVEAEEQLRGKLTETRLRRLLRVRCRGLELSRGEFKSIEPMLVVALMGDLAQQVAVELRHEAEVKLARLAAARLSELPSGELDEYLTQLATVLPHPSATMSALVLELLRDNPAQQRGLAQAWRLPTGELLSRRLRRQQRADASRLERFNRVVSSLRSLARTDWDTLIEDISPVVALLRRDPSGYFPRMDGPTRSWYGDRVADLAKWSQQPERAVAATLVQRAGAETGVSRHIGYHLIDDGARGFERAVGAQVPWSRRPSDFARRHPAAWLFTALGLFAGLFTVAWVCLLTTLVPSLTLVELVALTVVALLPISQIGLQFAVHYTLKVAGPIMLPKLRFPRALPQQYQAAVIVPTMLRNATSVRTDIEQLEVRYLANPDGGLSFGLLTDFLDSPVEHLSDDQPVLDAAAQGIRDLQERYPQAHFFLLHRPRSFNPAEGVWMGEERKRGKLEAFNRLILGQGRSDWLLVGDESKLRAARFVITLDEDTELPPGAGKRLVETLAHPLNAPELDSTGRRLARGFGIIQPRVATSIESGRASRLSRLLNSRLGIDPYMVTYSDLYSDLAKDAIFHGKGIYDPRAFMGVVGGRLPHNRILSHDLIEGSYLRVALATDIMLFDSFPSSSRAMLARNHRWIRGDWQIAAWLGSRVPLGDQDHERNPFRPINRWKILDNLRRSLLPIASTGLFVVAFTSHGWARVTSLILALLSFYLPSILALPGLILSPLHGRRPNFADLGSTIVDNTYHLMMSPRSAWLSLDAIARAWYRLAVSHRHLLQWQTAADAGKLARHGLDIRAAAIASASLLGFAQIATEPSPSTVVALLVLGLWVLSPIVMLWLDRPPVVRQVAEALTAADRDMLRRVALQTWRFFDELMIKDNHFLPPDNYQVTLKLQVAQRTSPTNIGLGILAWLAARDLGFITVDQLAERTAPALDSLGQLETYRGHIYNWYRTDTLEPLLPRYVSMVDSGNLMASLWAFRQGVLEQSTRPLIEPAVADGWLEIIEDLRARVPRLGKAMTSELAELAREAKDASGDPVLFISKITALVGVVRARATQIQEASGPTTNFLIDRLFRQAAAWQSNQHKYLDWYRLLAEPPAEVKRLLAPSLEDLRRQVLATMPTLVSLSRDELPPLSAPGDAPALQVWWAKIVAARRDAATLAAATIAGLEQIATHAGELADRTDMRFLYEPTRKAFHVGYNLDEAKLDASFYDLLASEARLGSFTAIAAGQVPAEHWWSLGRNSRLVDRFPVLLAWSGTMFEFLMPRLLMHDYPDTLLSRAMTAAVTVQRRYARKLEIPWGISESAHSSLDYDNTYQYRAFGVPAMGIESGLEKGIVVAPYATLLALPIAPTEVMQNLRTLEKLGFRGDMGFFEAVDYRRPATASGERGVGAFTYMAHHQAMGLLAITNILTGDTFPKRFHRDLRVRSARTLLHERAVTPERSRQDTTLRNLRPLAPLTVKPVVESSFGLTDPLPKAHILTNGNYTVMVTTTGSGFSHWKGLEVNRWSADALRNERGSYVYLRDPSRPEPWSTTFEPTLRDDDTYRVTFRPEKAIFERTVEEITSRQEVYIAPDHDVEIRRIRLRNDSSDARTIEATSVLEFGLAPHEDLVNHPAFRRLFIGVEALAEQDGVLAHRRLRSGSEQPVWVAHLLVNLTKPASRAQFQNDREQFLGRRSTPQHPQGLGAAAEPLAEYPLDPIAAVTQRVELAPHATVELVALTIAATTRDEVIRLANRYRQWSALARARQVAWSLRQAELQRLQITEDEAGVFPSLVPYLVYPNHYFKEAARGLVAGGATASVSTTELPPGPCMIAAIDDISDLELARQLGLSQKYLAARGLHYPLVFLVKLSGEVGTRIAKQLEELAESLNWLGEVEAKSQVHIWQLAHLSQERLEQLTRRARIVIDGSDGSLSAQLDSVTPLTRGIMRPRLQPALAATSTVTLPMEFPNGYGGFTDAGRSYAITVAPGLTTPAPWSNVMAGPHFGALVTERGGGFSWMNNAQEYRLTPWRNEPLSDVPGELLYVHDLDSDHVWSPQPGFHPSGSAIVTHGPGRSSFEGEYDGLRYTQHVFVPVGWRGPATVKVQRLRISNTTDRPRNLRLTLFAEWVLGTDREHWQEQIVTGWDDTEQMITAQNPSHPDYPGTIAFAATNRAITDFTTDRTEFLGPIRGNELPHGLGAAELTGRIGHGLDPVAVMRSVISVPAGADVDIDTYLGTAQNAEAAAAAVNRLREDGSTATALAATSAWWDDTLSVITVESPNRATDIMMNGWLLYQTIAGRVWGRTGYYQSSGAYGFRDQLQDSMALVYSRPDITRGIILEAARHQFLEGDVQHWWMPGTVRGLRSLMTDDRLWLPYVVTHYVNVTGDSSILNEKIPYLTAPPLLPGQLDNYGEAAVSDEQGTILDHCQRAVNISLTKGAHKLPLMGAGDWNDGLNLVGALGTGESVWLGWFEVSVLNGLADLLDTIGHNAKLATRYRTRGRQYTEAIDESAWDGQWYLRAFYDDGTPLGTAHDNEAQIDSLSQSWSVLAGTGKHSRRLRAIDSALTRLVDRDHAIVNLLSPPFDHTAKNPGYIKGYLPGVRENGGQYTHAALWLAMATARLGRGTEAVEILRLINPINHALDAPSADRYSLEPYVMAGDVYSLAGHEGRGGWSWYTGSSAWSYRAWLEDIFGFRLRGNLLEIDPCIDHNWPGFKLTYRYRTTTYVIEVSNPHRITRGVADQHLDGHLHPRGPITLVDDGATHILEVRLGF